MSRVYVGAWLVALLAAAPPGVVAAERKPAAKTSNSSSTRGDILAALRAEAAGDNDRRSELLYKAWLAERDLPEANWHTGRVRNDGHWLTIGEAVSHAVNDPDAVKYQELRQRAKDIRGLRELAHWCRKHGMEDRAQLHWAQLLSNPAVNAETRREAIQALKLELVGGMWLTHDEVAARRRQQVEAQAALEKWLPVLSRLQPQIDGDNFQLRDAAAAELQNIDQPAVIVALDSMLTVAGPQFQEEAVKRLAKFREFEATLALTHYAVGSPHALVRRSAAAALKNRPWTEFVPALLAALHAPLRSQFQVRADGRGRLVYDRAIVQEGTTSNQLLLIHHLSVPSVTTQHYSTTDIKTVPRPEPVGTKTTKTITGNSPIDAFAVERQSLVTRAQLDQSAVQMANNQIAAGNEKIYEALEAATGQQQPREAPAWWTWWQDYNQRSWPKPTYYFQRFSERTYAAQLNFNQQTTGTQWAPIPSNRHSCFVAGTQVRTEDGPQPIESIQPGDRVLAQEVNSGELAYKVVLRTTVRPPAEMVRLTMGDDMLVATISHPIWINGQGWKMARDVKTGDLVHSLGGAVTVDKVEPVADQAAYNLVVDDFNTYFVGLQGILVHDNEFRRPTMALVPGLIESNHAE